MLCHLLTGLRRGGPGAGRSISTSILLLTGAAALGATSLPPFTRKALPNGAVVYLMPRKDVPLVTFRAVIRGGSESDPDGKAGLADITAEMLGRGTAKRDAEKYAEALEFYGTSLGARVSRQATAVSVETLSANSGPVLDLVLEALLSPSFPRAEFDKLLGRMRDAARQMKDNPDAVLPRYFQAFLFGSAHPYSRPGSGDEVSLSRISYEDLRPFYERHYAARNLSFIVVGDFDPASLEARLTTALAAVPAGEPYRWSAPARPASRNRLLLVDKPDATQTYFEIGHPGLNRTHPDRVPAMLVNTLLGGRFTSLLNDALRVSAGLTYGAGSQVGRDRLDGAFVISSYTRTNATVQAIDLALSVLEKLRKDGITAEQLASVKAYVKGNYPTDSMETAGQLSALVQEMDLFGLPRSEFDDLFARIDSVTLDEANTVLRKHFGAEALTFVLVGNAAAIREQVKKYARELVEVKVTDPGYQVK